MQPKSDASETKETAIKSEADPAASTAVAPTATEPIAPPTTAFAKMKLVSHDEEDDEEDDEKDSAVRSLIPVFCQLYFTI